MTNSLANTWIKMTSFKKFISWVISFTISLPKKYTKLFSNLAKKIRNKSATAEDIHKFIKKLPKNVTSKIGEQLLDPKSASQNLVRNTVKKTNDAVVLIENLDESIDNDKLKKIIDKEYQKTPDKKTVNLKQGQNGGGFLIDFISDVMLIIFVLVSLTAIVYSHCIAGGGIINNAFQGEPCKLLAKALTQNGYIDVHSYLANLIPSTLHIYGSTMTQINIMLILYTFRNYIQKALKFMLITSISILL
jgi:adenine-specific DNA methylase